MGPLPVGCELQSETARKKMWHKHSSYLRTKSKTLLDVTSYLTTALTSHLQDDLTCTPTSTHIHVYNIMKTYNKNIKIWTSRTSKSSKPALVANVTIPLPLYRKASCRTCCHEQRAVGSCSLACSHGSLQQGKLSHSVPGVWTEIGGRGSIPGDA